MREKFKASRCIGTPFLFENNILFPYNKNMPLTQKQKENISKYLFDISKLSFGGMVVGRFFASEGLLSWVLMTGITFSLNVYLGGDYR
jgi:hypothetical protein